MSKQHLPVYRDGELDPELNPSAYESFIEAVESALRRKVHNLGSYAYKQARMALFDARNGTSYRKSYNKLMHEKKLERFEESIGLVRV